MSRRYAMVALLALGLAACTSSRLPPPNFSPTGTLIHATNSRTFDPVITTVVKGGRVEWENDTGIDHNITFENGAAFIEPLNDGANIPRVFTTVGTFSYYCAIHGKSMHGIIIVAPLP